MDVWMDGFVDEWMDTNLWMDRSMYGWIDGWMDEWIHIWMDR
jgi:hypothetical protein